MIIFKIFLPKFSRLGPLLLFLIPKIILTTLCEATLFHANTLVSTKACIHSLSRNKTFNIDTQRLWISPVTPRTYSVVCCPATQWLSTSPMSLFQHPLMSNRSYRTSLWSAKELWRYVFYFLSPAVIIFLYIALVTSSHFLKDYFWDKKRCIIVQCSLCSLFFTQLHFKSSYYQPTVSSVSINFPFRL